MKENNRRLSDDDDSIDDDQLRENTTNETIREVNGDPDMNLNNLAERSEDSGIDELRTGTTRDTDHTQGVSYTPNDASGVRSGGVADMDDQTAGGAGLNTGVRRGAGSNLTTKTGVSGSDFDGQNATS